MLPRLRFVVASLVIAVLPMVLLGAGMAPSAHPTSPAELSRADKPVVLGPAEYSETQYRLDRISLSYARRENELGKLRTLAAAPLENWIAAPAGAASESTGTVTTVTTDGPAVVTVNTSKPDKAAEVTVSVTVAPADKGENADKPDKTDKAHKADKPEKAAAAAHPAPAAEKPAAEPEADTPAPAKSETAAAAAESMTDAPKAAVPAPPGQSFAALTPPKAEPSKTETSALPQVHVVAPHAKHKPRARVARKPKAARTPPPAAQKPPPFFELFVWLFNIKPDANGQVPAGSASQLQQQQLQQQTRSSVAPTAGIQTASQP
jgi:hypothetical protein